MKRVFFDLETGGIDPKRHPIIQIAAIATDAELNELESFECKLRFNANECDPKALEANCFNAETWSKSAVSSPSAISDFSAFLGRHASVQQISKRTGRPYYVAQMVSYNGPFDGDFLKEWYCIEGAFMPASYRVMCAMQRVLWHFDELPSELPRPVNFKLGTVCQFLRVSLEVAHDAMADVRATVDVLRAIRAKGGAA